MSFNKIIKSNICLKCNKKCFQSQPLCMYHYKEVYDIKSEFRKEIIIKNEIEYFLKDKWLIDVVHNQKLNNLNIRPDIQFTYLGKLFVIEIDENQHRFNYNTDTEKKRLNKMLENVDILIRFNPDEYITNKKYPPIWKRNVHVKVIGKLEVEIEFNKDEFIRRMNILKYILSEELKNTNSTKTKLIKLFFNSSKFFIH